MKGPLSGIRVIEWATHGVGPFAGSVLGRLGADEIRIENAAGDWLQSTPPTIAGLGGIYIAANHTKRSIRLDLRDANDMQVLWDLIERSDVIFSNYRAGSAEGLGLGYDAVRKRNPNIVYCLCTGWGDVGPMRTGAASDPLVQAHCGWCSITGQEGELGEYLRVCANIDFNAGSYIVGAVLTGLAERERTGRGQKIELSMLEAALAMQSTRLAEYLGGGVLPQPLGSASSIVAPSQAFRCLDGYIAVSAETQGQWQRLCDVVGCTGLAQRPEFATNAGRVHGRRALAAILEDAFKKRPVFWWTQQLTKARVPNAAFLGPEMVMYHPQIRDNSHLVELESGRSGKVWYGGVPWKFTETPGEVRPHVLSGEHTSEIRQAVGTWEKRNAPRPQAAAAPGEASLAGLKVVEITNGIIGPYCGSLLADNGAAVVKVELPRGDHLREWGPPFVEGASPAFIQLNRNKRSLRLDPATDAGRLELDALVRAADVVLLDWVDADGRTAQVDAMDLHRRDPRQIICSVSAYGEEGPLALCPGSELTIQAMSNSHGALGSPDRAPVRMGADQASMTGGLAAYQGILAALVRRGGTGHGDIVRVSALGALLLVKAYTWTMLSSPEQWPGLHLAAWTDPPFHGYEAADAHIYVVTGGAGQLRPAALADLQAAVAELGARLPDAIAAGEALPKLAPPWPVPQSDLDLSFWETVFRPYPWRQVQEVFARHGMTVLPFNDYAMLDDDPQIDALQAFVPMSVGKSKIKIVRMPWRTERARAADVPLIENP
jgi:crotonobetainyl-CoA:carnitine CoA-transferase CaiB-like acyl-CoA transferase